MTSIRRRRFGPRLTVSVSGANYDELCHLADAGQVSISWVIRNAIEEYLRTHADAGVPPVISQRERHATE